MDPITHTIIALACIYFAYKVGTRMRAKAEIEEYTMFLEEKGYVYIEQMKDGSYEFIKHWKHQEQK